MSNPINCTLGQLAAFLDTLRQDDTCANLEHCTCLRDREVVSYVISSLDTDPLQPSKSTPIVSKFCKRDNKTALCPGSPYSQMLPPLTATRGEGSLTALAEDSRVRISQAPEKERVSAESALASGLSTLASFARFDHDSSLWRTPQCSLLAGLDLFLETWPRWGLMQNGVCWELPTWTPLTKGIGSGLSLPTPTVCGNYNRKGASANSGDGLATVVNRLEQWPTPTAATRGAHNGEYAGQVVNNGMTRIDTNGRRWGATLQQSVALRERLPTPTAHNAKESGLSVSRLNRHEPIIQDHAGGPLNPAWVAWLMGWPLDWCSLAPLSRESFDVWLASRDWWREEPANVPRTAQNVPKRAQQLKALGNGQVPDCAALAWRILTKGNP